MSMADRNGDALKVMKVTVNQNQTNQFSGSISKPQISSPFKANQPPFSKHQQFKKELSMAHEEPSHSFSGSMADREADDVEGSDSEGLNLMQKAQHYLNPYQSQNQQKTTAYDLVKRR